MPPQVDTNLPDRFQEQLEQTLRDVLTGLTQTDYENRRELPPAHDDALNLEPVPELATVAFASPRYNGTLTAELHFTDEPPSQVPLVPDEIADPAYDFPARVTERAPTYLGELGGAYTELAEAVVDTLAAYCDAPSYAPHLAFLDGEADLLCTSCYGEVITFSAHVEYPEYIPEVYGEGRRDVAQEYGLPF